MRTSTPTKMQTSDSMSGSSGTKLRNDAVQDPQEELPKGTNLPRKDWVTLNRTRSEVGRTQKNYRFELFHIKGKMSV